MSLDNFSAVFLPYCIDRQKDGRYAVLNREYKPVGFYTNDFINYKEYPVLVKFKGLGPKTAAKISHEGKQNLDFIYLYGCNPIASEASMKAYLARLKILAKLSIEEPNRISIKNID